MKHILVFGAVRAASAMIEYLTAIVQANQWQLTVTDADRSRALSLTRDAPNTNALALNSTDALGRRVLVATADLVISLYPPIQHFEIALDCLRLNKHLLMASNIDEQVAALAPQVESKGLLFLYDLRVEHLNAMQFIDQVNHKGGAIRSFVAHTGELPLQDDNPWRYRYDGQYSSAGAVYKEEGLIKHLSYEQLFDPNRIIEVPEIGQLAWIPTNNSLQYIPLYHLEEAATCLRTTLHYPEFCFGWKHLIELKLTDETPQYDTDGMSLQTFFQVHFARYGFSEWIEKELTTRFTQTKLLLEKLQQLLDIEQEDFMIVDNEGQLMDVNLDEVKTQAAATVAGQMHEANLSMKQLLYLGMDDADTVINKGLCSAADVMQFILEKKLSGNNPLLVVQQAIEYEKDGNLIKEEQHFTTGKSHQMIGTIAALILENKIAVTGLHLPVDASIYEPVLAAIR